MRKKRILILDDEPRIRANYFRLFKAAGSSVFEVMESSDVCEASRILAKCEIDLLLLDIRMPGVNGNEFYEVLKHSRIKPDIIVISVYPVEHQKRLIPDALDYYDKTQGPLGLLEKVTHVLSQPA